MINLFCKSCEFLKWKVFDGFVFCFGRWILIINEYENVKKIKLYLILNLECIGKCIMFKFVI